jgi:cytidylate kinase
MQSVEGRAMSIITISRGTMSGGQALADCLCGTLEAPCVGREAIVAEAADRLGVAPELLTQKLENAPGLWERLTLERRRYVVAVQAALAEHVATGNIVYHGYAGQLLLRGVPAVVRVRLIAPMEMRIRAVMDRHDLRRDAAEAYIRQVDEERVRWTRLIYDVDLADPQLYDLVLNLENISVQSACGLVVAATKRPEFEITETVRVKLADFDLACRVKVALATAAATRTLELDVVARDGAVTVTGQAPEPAMLTHVTSRFTQEIEEVVAGVRGVQRVELQLEAFDPYH